MKKSLIITLAIIAAIAIGAGIFIFYKPPIQTLPENAKIAENPQTSEIKLLTEEEISQMTIEEIEAKIAESEQQIKDLSIANPEERIRIIDEAKTALKKILAAETTKENPVGVYTPEGIVVTLLNGNSNLVSNTIENYKITIPKEWKIVDSPTSSRLFFSEFIGEFDPNCSYCFQMEIIVTENTSNQTLEEWIDNSKSILNISDSNIATKEKVVIDGVNGYKVQQEFKTFALRPPEEVEVTAAYYYYFVQSKGKVYSISFGSHMVPSYNEPIMATFKFLE